VPRPIAEAGASRLSLHFAPLDLPPVEVSLVWSRRLSNDPAHAWLRAVVRAVTPR
jgi:DNA-binding transcriptional LysR family regulator